MLWQRGESCSQDLREHVFAAADDGEMVTQIARLLRVSAVVPVVRTGSGKNKLRLVAG